MRKRLADRDHAVWYARWVRRYLDSAAQRPELPVEDRVADWLEHLSRSPRIHDWQVRQADDAVRIYLRSFLGQPAPASGAGGFDSQAALHRMTDALAVRHHAASTRRTYLGWARRFLDYRVATGRPAGSTPTSEDASLFMAYLAKRLHVSASTQNQAFSGVLFFFRHGIGTELEGMAGNVRAHRGRKLPTVLTPEEVQSVLSRTSGTSGLMLRLIYGSGVSPDYPRVEIPVPTRTPGGVRGAEPPAHGRDRLYFKGSGTQSAR